MPGWSPASTPVGRGSDAGAWTKTGNAHVRHVVVEAAWHYRHAPGLSGPLKRRQAGQPAPIQALSWQAQGRLHRRYRRLLARGKPKPKVIVAIGRELLGFIWAVARAAPAASAEAAA